MLNSVKRHDRETEAMWSVNVSWSSIMIPRFLAVLEGTRDKESILILWWIACLAGKTISSVLASALDSGVFNIGCCGLRFSSGVLG